MNGLVTRSEQVDTRAVLNGDPGDANNVDPKIRLRERERVLRYWPDDLVLPVREGLLAAPPWRLYLDPTGWSDVDPAEVHDYARSVLEQRGRWPSIDELHLRFGRVTNHRGPGENPEQLLLG